MGIAGGQSAGGSGGSSPMVGPVSIGGMEGCGTSVATMPENPPKVDIVWVVDASGSMLDEQKKIGTNITQFANDITMSGLDIHIVMMTTSAGIPVICPPTPPDPAAGTALAGDPRYMFINSMVDSNNALTIAKDNFPQYQSFLRPDAALHFVIVTDDESNYPGATAVDRAAQFLTDMVALAGRPFIQHTISSEGPTACKDPTYVPDPASGLCVFAMLGGGAAAVGETYWDLAMRTGGITQSICQQDWSAIFVPLTQAVIDSAPLPCDYPIPAPPMGMTLQKDKVNVGYTPFGGMQDFFPNVKDDGACADAKAWHFASDASKVVLCPAACDAVAHGGKLDVAFGCKTIFLE